MHIGTLRFTLLLHEGSSLKDKRHTVHGLVRMLQSRFHVAAAEVADLDIWRRATIGVAVVSNDSTHCNRVLDKVLDFVESSIDAELADVELELF